jgi:uncharacterized small protein (DUF1192 family)
MPSEMALFDEPVVERDSSGVLGNQLSVNSIELSVLEQPLLGSK